MAPKLQGFRNAMFQPVNSSRSIENASADVVSQRVIARVASRGLNISIEIQIGEIASGY